MQKYSFLIVTAFCVLALSGCLELQRKKPVPAAQNVALTKKQTPGSENFSNQIPDRPTAIESAIELSKKYAELTEDLAKMQEEKKQLAAKNESLQQQIAKCKNELIQTQKELAEANELLVDMRVDLNNWKSDILGFREEMRKADKAQLETLLKILTILGG